MVYIKGAAWEMGMQVVLTVAPPKSKLFGGKGLFTANEWRQAGTKA